MAVPGRPHFRLQSQLGPGGNGQSWLARHEKTGELRVYKFSADGERLAALKREATIQRVLRESLGKRAARPRRARYAAARPPAPGAQAHIAGSA